MNRKVIIIILIIAFLVSLGIYLFIKSSQDPISTPREEQLSVEPNDFDSGVVYDPVTGSVSKYNPISGGLEKIMNVAQSDPVDIQVSPDSKNIIVATDPNQSTETVLFNPDLTNIILLTGSGEPSFSAKGVFSAKFIDNERLIYQDFSSGTGSSLIIRAIPSGEKLNQINIDSDGAVEIYMLDSSSAIISDYSSDVGDVSSKIVEFSSGTISQLLSGEGFQFKTLPGSKLFASQTSQDNQVSTKLTDRQTKQDVISLAKPISNIAWSPDGKFAYFSEGLNIIAQDLATGVKSNIASVTDTNTLHLEVLLDQWLYIRSADEVKIIKL